MEPLRADMFDPGCESRRMPIRLGDKWSAKIIRCLEAGPRRFTELRVPLTGITAKVLSESLRAMERDGFVTRTAYDEHPPRVEYALSPLGRSLLGPLETACAWAREHQDDLARARTAYAQAARAGDAGRVGDAVAEPARSDA